MNKLFYIWMYNNRNTCFNLKCLFLENHVKDFSESDKLYNQFD